MTNPMKVSRSDTPGSLADYHIDLTEEEFEALKAAVKDADGRKSEVKLAREVLGL